MTDPATSALERAFPTFARGTNREDMLRSWRCALRMLTNPDTGLPFSEAEIALATAEHSRWYAEADAIDLVELVQQQRALWLADQVRTDRASMTWLERYHGKLWGQTPLGASGGSGTATAVATVGTVFVGSTILPDPVAAQATAPDGKRYQVLWTVVTPVGGTATLTLKAIDTGTATNLAIGTTLTWSLNKPVGASATATVATTFSGGAPAETAAQFGARIDSYRRHKASSGNWAHFRAWAREASSAVEDAFVYCSALHAGSVIVCPMQRRAGALGPLARIASAGTLVDVIHDLVPPASPNVPGMPFVYVLPAADQATSVCLSLAMLRSSAAGWADAVPWPGQLAGVGSTITAVADQQHFTLTIPAGSPALPTGVTAPQMMVWDLSTSRWEKLLVTSVTALGGNDYAVVLTSAPTLVIAPNMWISPYTARLVSIAGAIEAYFDSLGPGELVNLSTDSRAHRAFRSPQPTEEWPQRFGSGVISYLQDALRGALSDSVLESATSTPAVPSSPGLGPLYLSLFHCGIYAL